MNVIALVRNRPSCDVERPVRSLRDISLAATLPAMRGVPVTVVVAVAMVACAGEARERDSAAAPPRAAVPDSLVLLHRYEVAMCECTTPEYEASHELGDECPGDPSGKTNAMIRDQSWRRVLDARQNAEADRLLERIRRCFQASEGDPLPPAHDEH